MKSLRLRLLVLIAGSLLVLWALVAAWMLADVRAQLRSALDERLAASARMVAGLVSQLPPAAGLPRTPAPLLDVIGRDGLACEVSLLRGEVSVQTLARTSGSPGLDGAAPGYGTRTFGGKQWRTYVLDRGGIRVATADRLDLREALMRETALAAGLPFAVAVAGTLAMLWFAIGRGLAPLERVRIVLERRSPGEDEPLPAMPVPRELEPLVGTIAHLLSRVRSAISRERRFTDDAAHELRTPLTAVKTHLQVLRLASAGVPLPEPARESLVHAGEGVQRMQRTIEQLLLLARLDGGGEDAGPAATCDPGRAARQAIHEAETARGEPGRIRLQDSSSREPVAAPETLLLSAVRNLLDNALRAAPPGTPVLLRIEPAGSGQIAVTVLDDGPGLTPAECGQAVERFWKRSTSSPGSGLGLAIVSSIAQRCGGSFELRQRAEGGLEARLTLRAAGDGVGAPQAAFKLA